MSRAHRSFINMQYAVIVRSSGILTSSGPEKLSRIRLQMLKRQRLCKHSQRRIRANIKRQLLMRPLKQGRRRKRLLAVQSWRRRSRLLAVQSWRRKNRLLSV